MRKLDNWIEGWKRYREEVSESPFLYNEWVAVSMISAVLKRKIFLPWDSRIYPNFYIVLIGPAGEARKGSAMSPGNKILRELGVKLTAESTTREALIQHLKKASDNFKGDDRTIHQFSALTVYSEEFTTFTGYDNKELMAALSNWWDCPDTWIYETISRGKEHIDGIYLNLIGATVPELFRKTLPDDTVGGGLLSRIICVYEENRSQIIIFPHEGDPVLRRALVHDLNLISNLNGEFKTDKTFDRAYAGWYPFQHKEVSFNEERLRAYVGRRSTHLRKLCMIINASREGGNIITEQDFKLALNLLHRTEVNMPKTFAGVGQNTRAEIIYRILAYIRAKRIVSYSELQRKFLADIDEEKLPVVVATLEKAKHITLRYKKNEAGNYTNEFSIVWREDDELKKPDENNS